MRWVLIVFVFFCSETVNNPFITNCPAFIFTAKTRGVFRHVSTWKSPPHVSCVSINPFDCIKCKVFLHSGWNEEETLSRMKTRSQKKTQSESAVWTSVWTNASITCLSKYDLSPLLCFRPPIQATNRTANHSAVKSSEQQVCKSGGCGVWKMIKLLLLFAVLAAVGYYAYIHMMEHEEVPAGV